MSTNKEWLDLTVEETLEPDLPICDPHHHLWEFRHERVAHCYLLNVNGGGNMYRGGGAKMYHGLGGSLSA